MAFKELLESIADENLRKQLDEEFSKVNKENGERGRKLIEKDDEINRHKTSGKQKSEWETQFQLFKTKGYDAKDIPAILETLEVQKTAADELKLITILHKDTETKLKALEKENRSFKIQSKVDAVFNEARKNFKNEKGEALTVLEDFIDKGKLYADISDPDNAVLLEQRAKEVLTGALQTQESMRSKFGFQGAPTHPVIEGSATPGANNNIAAELQKIAKEQGPQAALDTFYNLQKVNA
jgi:hypothetical protein